MVASIARRERSGGLTLVVAALIGAASQPARAQQPPDSATSYFARARFMTDSGTPAPRDSILPLWRRVAELMATRHDTLREAEAWHEAARAYRSRSRSDSAWALTLRAAAGYHAGNDKSREARAYL